MMQKITVLGAGTIGMGWAVLFLASGREVTVYDPSPDVEQRMRDFIANAAPALRQLGWRAAGDCSQLHFDADPVSAVRNADFIQESIPERLELKHQLYTAIEPVLQSHTIVATSTSGLTLSELQRGFKDPRALILGHPFNPPHLIPLVELMVNQHSDDTLLARTRDFYESLGKEVVTLHREIPGHIANRLQAAIWRETIHLAKEGVASLEDIDKAVAYGPGLRWAALGPNALFHLGGGPGGIEHFCQHLGGAFESWWNDLGSPDLDAATISLLKGEMDKVCKKTDSAALTAKRDTLVLEFISRIRALDNSTRD
ncbi:MAG: 3-hydroxyacyl-CoA dehydrogenase family protein [Pseudomonadales bacterium]